MDVMQAIFTRRSIRNYTEDNVSEENIRTMLEAAMAAPSANNRQPWHYVVISDRQQLDRIPEIHEYASMAADAPLAILVCGDKNRDSAEGYLAVDCAAATQNLLLAAHSIGLGAVWCGVYPRDHRVASFREAFSLPEHILPIALIVIGHPAETKAKENRYKASQVRYNRW